MATTAAGQRAVDKYKKNNYMRIEYPVRKEFGEKVKAAAKAAGMSVSGYITQALTEYWENHPTE